MAGVNLLDRLKDAEKVEKAAPKDPKAKFTLDPSGKLTQENKQALTLFLLGLVIVFGSNLLLNDWNARKIQALQLEASELDQAMEVERKRSAQLKEVKMEADSYQARIDDLNTKLATVTALGENRNFLVRAIDFIVQEMPKTIWISEVKLDLATEGTLQLTGGSTTMQVVAEYMQKLQPGIFFNSWNLVETKMEEVKPVEGSRLPIQTKTFQISAKAVPP